MRVEERSTKVRGRIDAALAALVLYARGPAVIAVRLLPDEFGIRRTEDSNHLRKVSCCIICATLAMQAVEEISTAG